MQTDQRTAQGTGVAKIRALLIAARPLLQADAREFALAYPKKLPPRGQPFPDPSSAISHMRAHLQALRTAVLAEPGGSAAGASARELTALALLETDQSLDKLSQSYAASDRSSASELREESIRLANQAKSTSVKAGKALGIPWPL
jgi:hypothetical protein